jgi:hypothetical protein
MVTLSTTVYEKDFKFVLNKESWFYKYQNPLVVKKNVIINNINNIDEFLELKKTFEKHFEFFYSNEFVDEINKTFNISITPDEKSYYYSVQHYTNALINKENKFSFYVGPDCVISSNDLSDYFNDSINLLESDHDIISTTLPWVEPQIVDTLGNHEQDFFNITKRNDKFYMSKIFSDQVYFINTDKIKKIDFTITQSLHPIPEYGMNGFEFRLSNNLIQNNNYRAIYKGGLHYKHESF